MNEADQLELRHTLTKVISETNGVSLGDTLELPILRERSGDPA